MLSRLSLRGAEWGSWRLDDIPNPVRTAGAQSLRPFITAKSICVPGAATKPTPASRLWTRWRAGSCPRGACYVDEGDRTHRSLCQTTEKLPSASVRLWPGVHARGSAECLTSPPSLSPTKAGRRHCRRTFYWPPVPAVQGIEMGDRTVPMAEVDLQPTEVPKAGGALHNQDLPPACSECLPFIMDKFLLQQQVLERLAEDLLQAEQAVQAAYETATHEENIAENKYDTLGLEAGYLATGQARRAEAIRQAMANWRQFRPRPYDASKGIQLGALVCLVDSDNKQQQLFLGPDGGSMKLVSGAQLVQVISSDAPLARAILGKCEGDEVSILIASIRQQFEVLRVH